MYFDFWHFVLFYKTYVFLIRILVEDKVSIVEETSGGKFLKTGGRLKVTNKIDTDQASQK